MLYVALSNASSSSRSEMDTSDFGTVPVQFSTWYVFISWYRYSTGTVNMYGTIRYMYCTASVVRYCTVRYKRTREKRYFCSVTVFYLIRYLVRVPVLVGTLPVRYCTVPVLYRYYWCLGLQTKMRNQMRHHPLTTGFHKISTIPVLYSRP